MKKAVVLIAALLMVGSLAFAATPSFGMWGRTLFTVAGGSSRTGSDDAIFQGLGPNWGGYGPRMGLHMTFSTDKVEFKYVIYFNGAAVQIPRENYGGNQNIQIMSLYGTLKLVPGLLTVLVGKNDGDGWDYFRYENANTSNNINNNNCGRLNGWALLVAVEPKDSGLTIVGQWKLPNPNGFSYWSGVQPPFDADTPDRWTLAEIAKNANIGVSYQIPDLLKITAAYVTLPTSDLLLYMASPNHDHTGTNDLTFDNRNNYGVAPTIEPDHNILLRAQLMAVPGLTLIVEGRAWGFNVMADELSFKGQLVAAYSLDALWIGLGADFTSAYSAARVNGFGVYLEAKYNLGPITVALGANLINPDLDADTMRIKIMPWVMLNDFNTRIAFEYYIHDTQDSAETSWWAIPIYFTFSIW